LPFPACQVAPAAHCNLVLLAESEPELQGPTSCLPPAGVKISPALNPQPCCIFGILCIQALYPLVQACSFMFLHVQLHVQFKGCNPLICGFTPVAVLHLQEHWSRRRFCKVHVWLYGWIAVELAPNNPVPRWCVFWVKHVDSRTYHGLIRTFLSTARRPFVGCCT